MKASVQYGDFKGTSAADISDHESLEAVLDRLGADTARYKPVGARFYSGYEDFFSGSIIALDQNQSSEGEPYLVEINLEFSKDDFFEMFKRMDVVLLSRFTEYGDVEARDTINLSE